MPNVKQGKCEYQLLKSFDLTRKGNRTQVYRLRGGLSNHCNCIIAAFADEFLGTLQVLENEYAYSNTNCTFPE